MLDTQIREMLNQYLLRQISLREFLGWFTLATLDVDRSGNQAACELTYDIESVLAEYTNGHIAEEQFRRELLTIATNYEVIVEFDLHVRVRAVLSSASQTIRLPLPGTRLVVELA